jgi:hypothetical protein
LSHSKFASSATQLNNYLRAVNFKHSPYFSCSCTHQKLPFSTILGTQQAGRPKLRGLVPGTEQPHSLPSAAPPTQQGTQPTVIPSPQALSGGASSHVLNLNRTRLSSISQLHLHSRPHHTITSIETVPKNTSQAGEAQGLRRGTVYFPQTNHDCEFAPSMSIQPSSNLRACFDGGLSAICPCLRL